MIRCGVTSAYLDYALVGERLYVASFYERSLSVVKSLAASLNTDTAVINGHVVHSGKDTFKVFFSPVVYGKEKFYHVFAVNEDINQSFFISKHENREEDFYHYLMNNYNLPLLSNWKYSLFHEAVGRNYVKLVSYPYCSGINKTDENGDSKEASLEVYEVSLLEEDLKTMVSEMLMEKKIQITEKPMKPLELSSMDEYFKNYGHVLVENLNKHIDPISPLNGNIDYMVLNQMRLYPQQAAQVNGVTELLKKSNYAILNMGMGTGKTICATSIAEGYFIKKYLQEYKDKDLRDVYRNDDVINYRNIVMCPGHLVEKWAKEICSQIPFAKVTILRNFRQLVEIEKAGRKRNGKEWYVIGKDFAKLSYQSMPVPTQVAKKQLKLRFCKECGTRCDDLSGENFKCSCGSTEYVVDKISLYGRGMKCPNCGEVLMKNGHYQDCPNEDGWTLEAKHFARSTTKNQRCHLCGEKLWQPCVSNINMPGSEWSRHVEKNAEKGWHRATHYANKKHKATKTVWVHRKYEQEYWDEVNERPIREKSEDKKGSRKVAPAYYISKKLRGYFDFFILDEAHLFKGGNTAQGNAMQALVKASKKQLALTGTIAGGMATHLFYLLYRLDPERMRRYGYKFSDELKFAKTYGTVETDYQVSETDDEEEINVSSKGRQMGSPKVKPGISPLIFSDFLLDKAVFLDLSDMSRFLPKFHEVVELVYPENEAEEESIRCYKKDIECLKEHAKVEGRSILSTMLQYSLSYPDHPYGVEPIQSIFTGDVLLRPLDNHHLIEDGKLLEKEKRLVEILNQELARGRNSVVYCEFTGKPETCATHRLKEVIERECHLLDKEVVIIEANSPSADKREAWMHEKAEKGARIFIVNPRCVETGLDFCWTNNGVTYNYPTLIFYQLGYSLFTVWQASRRAYRLNQKEECLVYYMAYAGTAQQAVIQLIAEKQAATSAIQGKFSAEGLTAMAQGVDEKVRLAQVMADLDSTTGNGLQEMFDVLNEDQTDVSAYENYRPMQTYYELMDIQSAEEKENGGLLNFETFITLFEREKELSEEADDKFMSAYRQEKPKIHMTKRHRKLAEAGQLTLF